MTEHIFFFEPQPQHPLDPAGCIGWDVIRTEVGHCYRQLDGTWRISFHYYVRPPS